MTDALAYQHFMAVDSAEAVRICADPVLMAAAYRRVFGGVEGHAVLFDLMAQSGFCTPRGPEMDLAARAYHDGLQALVSGILSQIGLGAAASSAALTGALKAEVMRKAATDGAATTFQSSTMAQEPSYDRPDPDRYDPTHGNPYLELTGVAGCKWWQPGPADIAD